MCTCFFSCLGALLHIELTTKYFNSKEPCFDVPRITFGLHTTRLERTYAEKNEPAISSISWKCDSTSWSRFTMEEPTTMFVTLPHD